MALTYSPAPIIGSDCPDFHLPTVDQKFLERDDLSAAKVLVIMFICGHCPYVLAIEDRLLKLGRELNADVAFVAICSNDPKDFPEDEPAALFHRWREKAYPFPYLIDQSQAVAKAFGAVCTPDFFVFDEQRKLRYRGRLDDAWKNPQAVSKQELREAITALLKNQPVTETQVPSMGCSIKWKNS
jgi:peroxiredoxin